MAKIFKILTLFVLFFSACSDEKPQIVEQSETIPADVPIAQSETNTTIDENFPPEPVIEGGQ
ncbi:hypothetical protein [Campylobacter mucosalis]|uniref:Lipoprotein n=1 Tax=Campylobacter mucosalis CCUG 21559 TaxID=1032067 RepID=A0A6G5QEA3_9BACT|nr:hypothetical protein [Campylobacter mucosalis]QCD43919.1 hypothetical protein CMUC_0099 [Campylobacter mucosalis CCUG 21559]